MVTTTQDLASGLLDARVTATLTRRGWNSFRGWLVGRPRIVVKIVLFLVIFFAGRPPARLVSRAVARSTTWAKL